ncbi:MAG: queuine tRNA-ribosyltransferase family protein [Acidobacteriia bacterium]|nr:queuine tRNA-ribosyltransferase family protein [Terriglobia bacterium]
MVSGKLHTSLNTAHGAIRLPAYVPVTTFGAKYPLDDLVRPYLPRLAQAAMVSFHYARQMTERPALPLFVDSGGFASLFQNATVLMVGGLGVLKTKTEASTETLHPRDVLEFQEKHADVAFSLDFPIPPSMSSHEGRRRLGLTVANARWAIENRRRKDMPIFACVQGWDVDSYAQCVEAYAGLPFDGIAIGGLVPRVHDLANVLRIVKAVRAVVPNKPLHVFGLGKPGIVEVLFKHGVHSVDSSSYVKLAADGRLWGHPTMKLEDASPAERLNLALCNLATAAQRALPLSTSHLLFSSRLWEQ